MKIPNDTGGEWRAKKFAEYQHEVPPVDRPVLVEYAKRHSFTYDDCVRTAFNYGTCGCAISTLMLETMLPATPSCMELADFFAKHLKDFIFDGKRWERYPTTNRWLAPGTPRIQETLMAFHGQIMHSHYKWLTSYLCKDKLINYFKVIAIGRSFPNYGRLSADAFAELLIAFAEAKLLPPLITFPTGGIDWLGGSNVTAGTFNVGYHDDRADAFDRGETVKRKEVAGLNAIVATVERVVARMYGPTPVPLFAPKLCSFRNLFKRRRYGGYHHDWQLENLLRTQAAIPSNPMWPELFDIRKAVFPPRFLGELGGWTGIRKERKRLWVEHGLTGVEA